MKVASFIFASALALTLGACNKSDNLPEESTEGTVEVPADEAMSGVEQPAVEIPSETVIKPAPLPDRAAAPNDDEVQQAADKAAAAAEAATDAGAFDGTNAQ